MTTITDTDILFEKKLGANAPTRPDKSRLAEMVLEFCDQCEVRNGGTPGNLCAARQCRFVPVYREAVRVLRA
jgi:hypothetical protein